MRWIAFIAGMVFCVLGISGVLCGILAIIDPVGTKMADDADPFGEPLGFSVTLAELLSYAVLVAAGGFLMRKFVLWPAKPK